MRHLALSLSLAACASPPAARTPGPPNSAPSPPPRPRPASIDDLLNKPAPRFSLPSARDDSTITVPSSEVTVVTFFGTWALGWQRALPMLERLQKKHLGLRIVAVAMDEEKPKDVADRYAAVPIAWSGMGSTTHAEWLSGPYGGENKVFVLDRKGTIRFVHRGGKETTIFATPTGAQTVEDEITTLLKEP